VWRSATGRREGGSWSADYCRTRRPRNSANPGSFRGSPSLANRVLYPPPRSSSRACSFRPAERHPSGFRRRGMRRTRQCLWLREAGKLPLWSSENPLDLFKHPRSRRGCLALVQLRWIRPLQALLRALKPVGPTFPAESASANAMQPAMEYTEPGACTKPSPQ
jgi:hypothetical protein